MPLPGAQAPGSGTPGARTAPLVSYVAPAPYAGRTLP